MPLPTHPSDRSGRTMRRIGTSVPAWPFGSVSVSVEKLSPAPLALSPFPASPFPRLPESPWWDFHPSGFLLLLQNRAYSKAPSLHGRYPASSLLWASPTPCRASQWLCIPAARWSHSLPPDRVSQAPRLIFPRALSPTTPEGPAIACACCFTTGLVWLHPSRADWPPSYSYRGRIGFTCVTARVFASRVRQLHYWSPRSLGYVLNRQFTR